MLSVVFHHPFLRLPTCSTGFLNMSMEAGGSNPGRSYKYYAGTPQFPFGFGLSLTNFTVRSELEGTATLGSSQSTTEISVSVTNTGRRAGDDVVFAFFSPKALEPTAAEATGTPGSRLTAPRRQLFGFKRLTLSAGATKTVRFPVEADMMSLVDQAGRRWVAAGSYEIHITDGVSKGTVHEVMVGSAAAKLVSELPDGAV